MMRNYVALIHKDAESDWGVSFPDFPGVVTAGKSVEEVRAMAEEALAFHVEGLVADGELIPEPSSFEAVMEDRENRDAIAVLIGLKTDPPKALRVNLTFPEALLREIDRYAVGHGFTRSGFLAAAAKQAMGREAA
jgi:predicted RNase H-like HicB family nuclease